MRLVGQLKTSKEIARELNISPHTVDQRIKVAIRTLGVDGRAEAARMLAEYENEGSTYQSLVYRSPDIADRSDAGPEGVSEDGVDATQPDTAQQPDDDHAGAGGPESEPETSDPGGHNNLNVWQRLGLILAIAFGSAIAFGAILAGLDALSRLT